jgi:GNAT superfamily N-acetyltransferase
MIEMTYNPPYYEALIQSFGFGKAKDLFAWWTDVTGGLDDPKIARFNAVSERVKKRFKLSVRNVKFADTDAEIARIFKVYNESWQKNWGFVPVSEAEFDQIARDLKSFLVEELVLIVEHEGQPVGFALTAPNVNEVMPKDGRLFPLGWYKLLRGMKKTRTARLITLGVLPRFRKRGVEAILCVETALRVRARGMVGGEISWLLEDNDLVNRAAETIGAKLDRRYRLYGLTLQAPPL